MLMGYAGMRFNNAGSPFSPERTCKYRQPTGSGITANVEGYSDQQRELSKQKNFHNTTAYPTKHTT
jgi:hypothetical protein